MTDVLPPPARSSQPLASEQEAREVARPEPLLNLLLESPNQKHLPKEVEELLAR